MRRTRHTRPDYTESARQLIAQYGRERAQQIADREVWQAVNDVTYPMDGRIGLYQKVRDLLSEG